MSLRIVYVTVVAPSQRTGGGRHCYANLRSLCELRGVSVAYIGPMITERLPGLEGVRILLSRPLGIRDKVAAAVNGAATSVVGLFREWQRTRLSGFDLAFLETTRLGFAASAFAGVVTTVCCVHNVEADFMRGRRGLSRIASWNVWRSEAETLRRCDHLLVMHRKDLLRLEEVYRERVEPRAEFHPVCAMGTIEPLEYGARKRRIVIPGSLDQAYNEDGIRAFLRECWPSLKPLNVELMVAGRDPRRALKRAVVGAGATLVPNPESMAELIRDSLVAVAPDRGGAGMKLRVAEALSLGVPVVGTREALLGYENIDEFGAEVPSIAAMRDPIASIVENAHAGSALAARAREIWESRYSFETFSSRLQRWMQRWSASPA